MAELPPAAKGPVESDLGQSDSISSTLAAGGKILDAARQTVNAGIAGQLASAASTLQSVQRSLAAQISVPLGNANDQVNQAKSFVASQLSSQLSVPTQMLAAISGQTTASGIVFEDCKALCAAANADPAAFPPGASGKLANGGPWAVYGVGTTAPGDLGDGCVLPNGNYIVCFNYTGYIAPGSPPPPPPPPPQLIPPEPIGPLKCECPDGTYLNPEAPPPPDPNRPACPSSYLGWTLPQWNAYINSVWNPLTGVLSSDVLDLLSKCGVQTTAPPLPTPGAPAPTVTQILADNTQEYDYQTACDDWINLWCSKPATSPTTPTSPTVPPSTVTCPNCNISLSCPPPIINVQPCTPLGAGGMPFPVEPWDEGLAWKFSGEESAWKVAAIEFSSEWLSDFQAAKTSQELVEFVLDNVRPPKPREF